NAQPKAATCVTTHNNSLVPEPQLRGAAPTLSIPVTAVSQTDGNAIRAALGSGTVTATLSLDPAHVAGMDNTGHTRMYDPNPDEPGSSVSHWDVSAFPNLLMEPAINPDLTDNVDLTFHNFFDIGWFPQLVGVPGRATDAQALSF